MSSKPIELARRWVDLFNARDMEGLGEIVHPDIEAVSIFAGLEAGGVFRVHQGFPYGYFEAIDEIFSAFRLEPTDYIDLGNSVVVCGDFHGVAADSGAEIFQPMYAVWQTRDGLLYREHTFRSKLEGLEKLIEFERGSE